MSQNLPILFAANPVGTIVLGVVLLCVAFLMRRAAARKRRSPDVNIADQVREQFLAESAARKEIEKRELRLHEIAREVDALSQTRIAVLTELVCAADRAIADLDQRTATDDLTAEQRRMIVLLSQAGYRAGEIATLIGHNEEAVRVILGDDDRTESQAA